VQRVNERFYNKDGCRELLRKIFWPKRGELTGDWRKLQNEELYT
jgi:hypothetical protein